MKEIVGKAETVHELLRRFNASYGDLCCADKLPHYNTQNLVKRSMRSQCYGCHPGFPRFKEQHGLPFVPHAEFNNGDLGRRSQLDRQIAECIGNRTDVMGCDF
jgi:hypothetical protein